MSVKELEVQHYWRLMSASLPPDELRDELEVLKLHAETPVVKAMCAKALGEDETVYLRVANEG